MRDKEVGLAELAEIVSNEVRVLHRSCNEQRALIGHPKGPDVEPALSRYSFIPKHPEHARLAVQGLALSKITATKSSS